MLSFTIYLHKGAGEDVPTAIKLLRSWLYAEYSEGKLSEPPKKLLIVFGDTWPDELWLLRSMRITRTRLTCSSRRLANSLAKRDADCKRIDLIAWRYYKDVRLWWVIAEINNISNPLELQTGLILRIPAYERVMLEVVS